MKAVKLLGVLPEDIGGEAKEPFFIYNEKGDYRVLIVPTFDFRYIALEVFDSH